MGNFSSNHYDSSDGQFIIFSKYPFSKSKIRPYSNHEIRKMEKYKYDLKNKKIEYVIKPF